MRELNVQWFPGHMTKAKRMMQEELKLIDVVVEMLDARIPLSSSNPLLIETIGNKPKVIALNKTDLADDEVTKNWLEFFSDNNLTVVKIDSAKGSGVKGLVNALKNIAQPITDKWQARGVKNRNIRTMIVGIPNVGKSSLINRFAKSVKVRTADKPGVTRGKQWINVGSGLDVLDTPGVLWPKFEDKTAAFALAVTGAIKDDVFDAQEAAKLLVDFLIENYLEKLVERYKLVESFSLNVDEVLQLVASKRGCLRAGGLIDQQKVSYLMLKEFRDGLLGKISLEKPRT